MRLPFRSSLGKQEPIELEGEQKHTPHKSRKGWGNTHKLIQYKFKLYEVNTKFKLHKVNSNPLITKEWNQHTQRYTFTLYLNLNSHKKPQIRSPTKHKGHLKPAKKGTKGGRGLTPGVYLFSVVSKSSINRLQKYSVILEEILLNITVSNWNYQGEFFSNSLCLKSLTGL